MKNLRVACEIASLLARLSIGVIARAGVEERQLTRQSIYPRSRRTSCWREETQQNKLDHKNREERKEKKKENKRQGF